MNRIFHILLIILLGCMDVKAAATLTHLTTEGRIDASGLDVYKPRFGWQIVSDRKNVMQKSYRIIVASSYDKLAKNMGDMWDSGTMRSDASQWVEYNGSPLLPNHTYYWKVFVTTNKGKAVASAEAHWSTGLLDAKNWQGKWIGTDSLMENEILGRHSVLAARYLRKTFRIGKTVKKATIHISGLGNYLLFINGKRIGEDVLAPLPTEYNKTVAYDTYDVTSDLSSENAIGVVLAGGHYTGMVQNYQTNVRTSYGLPKLIANLIVEYSDGSNETIATDTTWKLTANGPIRKTSGYDGECYDATKELGNWTSYVYDDNAWENASIVDQPRGILRGNISPNMHIYETANPVKLHRYHGRYIADFGTNGAGRIRLSYHGNKGDTVCIRHAELLKDGDSTLYVDNLRGAQATATYICNGKQADYIPEFTFYGFRYIEITGADNLCSKDITRELVADRMDDACTDFKIIDNSGNNILNSIVDNARRGIRSNYKGMPIDCPQRDERMPWLGDRTVGCLGESYLMNNHALYAKWVSDICDSQRPDGNISDVSPAYWRLYNGNITWPAALPFSCDMLYRQYGDLRPMQDSYDAIKKFLKFVRQKHYNDGLVTYDRYGDWCVPPESPSLVHSQDPSRKTDGQLISTAYYSYICDMMKRYAGKFGYTDDERYFADEAAISQQALNDKFLVNGIYSNGTVTANLLPLAMSISPADRRAAIEDSLISTIVDQNDSHVSAGVIGIQWLMRYLSDSGHGDIAYRMATIDTYPGWGYMVKRGATTIWELWNGDTANPSMNSGNHVMLLGDLLTWCYECLAGIRPDSNGAGFKNIIIKPDYSVSALNGVSASHPSPYGIIRSCWQRSANKISLTITVPPNTTAKVYLPSGKTKCVGSGTYIYK